jgi:hypothetical protein
MFSSTMKKHRMSSAEISHALTFAMLRSRRLDWCARADDGVADEPVAAVERHGDHRGRVARQLTADNRLPFSPICFQERVENVFKARPESPHFPLTEKLYPCQRSLQITSLFLLASIGATLAADLIGQASVIDGDTIRIHGTRIRLCGIDTP